MANNYIQTSFYFRCGTSDNANKVACWINGGNESIYPDDLHELMIKQNDGAFDDDGWLDCAIADHVSDDGADVWISIDETGDLELLAIILRYAMATMTEVEDEQGFQWAETCSKPRVNEFGGGACFIKRGQDIRWMTTGGWLESQV